MDEFEGYVFEETAVSHVYTPEGDTLYALSPSNIDVEFDASGVEVIGLNNLNTLKDALLASMPADRMSALASNDERIVVTFYLDAAGEIVELSYRLRRSTIGDSVVTGSDLDLLTQIFKGLILQLPSAYTGSVGLPITTYIVFQDLI